MLKHLLGIILIGVCVSGCAYVEAPFRPPIGLLYTHIKAPLKLDVRESLFTDNIGNARTFTFQYGIWSFTSGDASVRNAMSDAFINKANYADYEYINILFGLVESVAITTYGMPVSGNEYVSTERN